MAEGTDQIRQCLKEKNQPEDYLHGWPPCLLRLPAGWVKAPQPSKAQRHIQYMEAVKFSRNPLDLIEADVIATEVIEAGGSSALMVSHLLRDFAPLAIFS